MHIRRGVIMEQSVIPIIIPAYQPRRELIDLLHSFENNGLANVIIVNDGSEASYDFLFSEVEDILSRIQGTLLIHKENQGKGKALKTAFFLCIKKSAQCYGCDNSGCRWTAYG